MENFSTENIKTVFEEQEIKYPVKDFIRLLQLEKEKNRIHNLKTDRFPQPQDRTDSPHHYSNRLD